MSDSFEKNTNEFETPDEESTVFSAPLEHKDKAPKKNSYNQIHSIIAICLVVAVLVTGTLLIRKHIKILQNEESTTSTLFEEITVFDNDSSKFTNVSITNSNGTFDFTTQKITQTNESGQADTTTYWTVDGLDISKLSNTKMNEIISNTANMIATREITTKTAEDCGFNDPRLKVSVVSSEIDPYTFLIGDESPDKSGYYLMIEGSDKIYLTDETSFSVFEFSLLDLADKTSIPATTFTSDTSDNKSEDGAYAYFDSLTISGKLFPETITIINNPEDTDSAALVPYLITTPIERYAYADNLTSLVYLFSNETAVSGAYAWDITDETLKEFGLDNPDAVVTMTIDGESRSFKISKIDNDYCAVVYDGAKMIRKCLVSTFEFLDLKTEDLYYKNLFMNSINDITALTLNDSEGEVKFDISYEEDAESNKTYHISVAGKEITTKYFQTFYADFVGIQCSNFTVDEITQSPSGKITFTFYDGSNTVIEFYKATETEYQYSIDGIHMGKIASSAFNKMIKNIRLVAADNEPT